MASTPLSLLDIVQDLHALEEELWKYESRYGLRSTHFYDLYQAGQLKDEDPAETRDYTDWATCIETIRHRESLYDALVREALRKTPLQQPISLAELRQTLKPAVARAA